MSSWLAGELQAVQSALSSTVRTPEQQRLIASFLKHFPSLQSFSDSLLTRLSEAVHVRKCAAGEVVCRAGEAEKQLWLVVEGLLTASVQDVGGEFVLGKFGPGNNFGEVVGAKEQTRQSTVTSVTTSILYVLNRDDFDRLSQATVKQELDWKVAFLRTAPLFEKLSRQGLARLAHYFKEASYARGDYVYKEGEQANSVFLIVEGEVEFVKRHSTAERESVAIETLLGPRTPAREPLPVRRLLSRKSKIRRSDFKLCVKCARELFGEEEVMGDCVRLSSAFCRSPHAVVLVMSKADFIRRMQNPEIWTQIHTLRDLKEGWARERIQDLNGTEAAKMELNRNDASPKTTGRRPPTASPPQKPSLIEDPMDVKVFTTDLFEHIPRGSKSSKAVEFSNSMLKSLETSRASGSRVTIRRPRVRSSRRHSPPPNFHAVPSSGIISRYREQRSVYQAEERLGTYDAEQLRLQREQKLLQEKAKQSLSPSKHNLFRRRSKGDLSESPGRKMQRGWM